MSRGPTNIDRTDAVQCRRLLKLTHFIQILASWIRLYPACKTAALRWRQRYSYSDHRGPARGRDRRVDRRLTAKDAAFGKPVLQTVRIEVGS